MDFARKHRDLSPTCPMADLFGVPIPELFVTSFDGPSAGAYYAWNEMGESERAGWMEAEPAADDAPRPCYRSIWDVCGLRRRPRRA